MNHIMEDDWEYPGIGRSKIHIPAIWRLIRYKKILPTVVDISAIAYKPICNIDISGARFKIANTSYPIIAVQNMYNPCGKEYRVIDGRHRISNHILQGNTNLDCYILKLDDIMPFIEKI